MPRSVSRRHFPALAATALLAPALLALAPPAPAASALAERQDLAALVDPMIGTFGAGFVFPGAAAPFGMTQVSPDTTGPLAYTGYLWSDPAIRGFSHVHVESMGVPAAGDVPFMPTVGPVLSTDPLVYASPFSHATEVASPGYYAVDLAAYGVRAELTAGLRVGMHRYAFPPVADANVLLHAGWSVRGAHGGDVEVVDARTVEGSAWTEQGYAVHFVAVFDRPFAAFGAWNATGEAPSAGLARASGDGAGAFARFDAREDATVVAKVGISFVSRANARLNLDSELPGDDFGFDALHARTRDAWNDALAAIEVEGGALADRVSFYTALYHAMHHPNVFTDANGEYVGHDGRVHVADGYVHHANYSLWDTYRAEGPLLALVAPDRYRDMMRTLVAIDEQAGRLPRWSLMNALPDFMVGEPAIPWIVDAWCRGAIAPADAETLYASMREAALERRRDPSYLALGYVPHESFSSRGASATLEHAIADFALALMADDLGRAGDRDRLLAQSASWRNLFDAETRLLRPRHADGSWLAPFAPESPEGWAEGTGWQYLWLAPHDVRGLVDAMGGDAVARERLDALFATALSAAAPVVVAEAQKQATLFGVLYAGNQYAAGNEHDLHAPYLYDYVGEPWKTQAVVRSLQGLYRPAPDGLPGNDDLGTLSAWFVWSALGLYPVTAGAPVYAIGSPLFDRASVRLPDGARFTIEAEGASLAAKYVRAATLDGAPLERAWIAHADVARGATLSFEMSAVPDFSWAAAPEAAPPSASVDPLGAFECA